MAKGGYKIISLKNIDFTESANEHTIPGIYEAIEHSYRKPILLSDFVYGSIERSDRYVVFGVSGGNYVANIAISADVDVLMCTVTPEDTVTIANA